MFHMTVFIVIRVQLTLLQKLIFFFFVLTMPPNQGLKLRLLHWKHKVLSTRPPGKFPEINNLVSLLKVGWKF